jgi:hypothetical protein
MTARPGDPTQADPDRVGRVLRGDREAATLPPPAPPGRGHNGGPPLAEEPEAGWRLWCWRRAHRKAWSARREIALRRLARAEELGMSYHAYTLEILERGRHL